MNMFKPVKAKTVEEYFYSLSPERRKAMESLDKFIKKEAPSLKPYFAYNMPGYGSFKYKNYKQDVIDWPIISLASQKNYMSLYICAMEGGKYIAEKYKGKLGKVSVGRSCVRFKKIEDLNLEGLKEVLKLAEKSPGFGETSKTDENRKTY